MDNKIKIINIILIFYAFMGYGQIHYAYMVESEVIINLHADSNRVTIKTDLGNVGSLNHESTPTTIGNIYYDFFYLPNNFTKATISAHAQSIALGAFPDCEFKDSYEVLKKDFGNVLLGNTSLAFDGCSMIQSIHPIHIYPDTNALTNGICIEEDSVELKYGYYWQFQLDSGRWKDFPSEYNKKAVNVIKVKDLLRKSGINIATLNAKNIRFRTGYNGMYTNIQPYSFVACSPKFINVIPEPVTCNYDENGSFELVIDRNLETNEKLAITIYEKDTGNVPSGGQNSGIRRADMIDNSNGTYSYKWPEVLEANIYEIKYQTGTISEDLSIGFSSIGIAGEVEIRKPKEVTYILTAAKDRTCFIRDDGYIDIKADGESGRTFFYQYLKNGVVQTIAGSNWIPFTNVKTTRITGLGKANYNVKVRDSEGCFYRE